MDKLIICKTDRGRYAVRPMSWAGIWSEKGQIQESLNHLALFIEKKDAEKFVEWKEAEEQGRLLKLEDIYQKVVIGQEVWIITVDNNVSFAQISRINECWSDLFGFQGEYCAIPKKGRGGWDFKYKDFGKTVFLTRQEAAAKLAEMEGKK